MNMNDTYHEIDVKPTALRQSHPRLVSTCASHRRQGDRQSQEYRELPTDRAKIISGLIDTSLPRATQTLVPGCALSVLSVPEGIPIISQGIGECDSPKCHGVASIIGGDRDETDGEAFILDLVSGFFASDVEVGAVRRNSSRVGLESTSRHVDQYSLIPSNVPHHEVM